VLITARAGRVRSSSPKPFTIRAHAPNGRRHYQLCRIPENLLESELFGTERGAFTERTHASRAVRAGRPSSIFLDEIGELAQSLQAKLLRVIEQGEFMRVGGKQSIHVDVRIIAATNRDLELAMREGGFRRTSSIA